MTKKFGWSELFCPIDYLELFSWYVYLEQYFIFFYCTFTLQLDLYIYLAYIHTQITSQWTIILAIVLSQLSQPNRHQRL